MGILARIVARFAPPSRRAAWAEESDLWVMDCKCGHTTSVAEMGGTRSGAASSGKKTIGRCGRCGNKFFGTLYKRPQPTEE